MGWTRLKMILAAVLAAANVLMFWNLNSLYRSTEYIPDEALRRVTLMLAENGIAVAESALDAKKPDLLIYEGALGEDYYSRVAEKLSGSSKELSFNTPTGFVMTMENGDRFSFQDGFGLRSEHSDAPEHLSLADVDFGALTSLSAADERRLTRTVEEYFRRAEIPGAETQALAFTRRLIRAGEDPATGIRYCTFAQDMRDTAVLNFISTAAVYEGEVIAVQGNWCFAQLDTSYSAQLMDQINILYSVKNRVLEERGDEGNSIVTVRASLSQRFVHR